MTDNALVDFGVQFSRLTKWRSGIVIPPADFIRRGSYLIHVLTINLISDILVLYVS